MAAVTLRRIRFGCERRNWVAVVVVMIASWLIDAQHPTARPQLTCTGLHLLTTAHDATATGPTDGLITIDTHEDRCVCEHVPVGNLRVNSESI
jgi:hypothetical protein